MWGATPTPFTSWGTEPSSKRQVTSVPGATSIAGGRNLRSLALTVVTPLTGWLAAGGGGGRQGGGVWGREAPWRVGQLLGAEGENDQEHAAQDEDRGEDELDDGDDTGRPGQLQAGEAALGGLDPLLGAVGHDEGDDGADGHADEDAGDGDDSVGGGGAVGLGAGRVAVPVAGRRPIPRWGPVPRLPVPRRRPVGRGRDRPRRPVARRLRGCRPPAGGRGGRPRGRGWGGDGFGGVVGWGSAGRGAWGVVGHVNSSWACSCALPGPPARGGVH